MLLGMYFAAGCFLGYVASKDRPKESDTITADIVKEGDKIDISSLTETQELL
jgi:hypothetical protein